MASALRQTLRPSTFSTPLRSAFRPTTFRQSMQQQMRRQTTTAAAAEDTAGQSAFSKLWNSEVGPKTVHFWAPIMKWGVVLAGAADFLRPASSLSLQQNMALMATGMIWTRWCFVIRPKNMFLASVNFLLFCVGAAQTTRVLRYRASLKENDAGAELKDAAKETKDETVDAAKQAGEKAKSEL